MKTNNKKINEKYLISINNFLNKSLTYKEINKIEEKIDFFWKKHYKNFIKYYSYEYLYISFNCFKKYSKNCVLETYKYTYNKNIKTILDYGAGIGLTTNLLQELFPKSQVYYINLKNSLQDKYFLVIKNKKIKVLNSLNIIKKEKSFDIIFASELFEHIEEPINLLRILMKKCKKYFIINNSFGSDAYGHFNLYIYNKKKLTSRNISKLFLKTIREEFEEIEIKNWNNRPRIFKRKKL